MAKTEKEPEKKPEYYYVTTPIYYANGRPHIGNTYTTTLGDALTRFYRFLGRDVFFLTGTDEHGDKVQQAAAKEGKTPLEFTNEVADLFKRTWADLGIEYSRFIRTTEPEHVKYVTDILSAVHEKGDIYFGEYGGLYCVGCERFLTEKELVDGKCSQHQTVPQYVKEENYFFRMSKYQDQLVKYLTEVNPDFIRPAGYRNEVLGMLREPLEDLCISRPKSRLTWGIELPFDKNYVTYVWFDALINYLTGINYPDGKNAKSFWAESEHLIGKDILKPHAVFWPTMLMAAGIPLYKNLSVHGYWITESGKMSKSLGNVVDPLEIKKKYGMDVYRYFVFREMAFGLDGTFSYEALDGRYNSDLANNLGNLVSRSLAMVHKYREGKVTKATAVGELEQKVQLDAVECVERVAECIKKMEVNRAMESLWSFIAGMNVYIDRSKPWVLAKEEKSDAVSAQKLDTVLYTILEANRVIAGLLTAFMPETSEKILKFLGFEGKKLTAEQTSKAVKEWGRLSVGGVVGVGETLFPRTDQTPEAESAKKTNSKDGKESKKGMEASTAAKNSESSNSETKTATEGLISFDDFSKVQLRVGQIVAAERVEKAEKLLKLKVDVGEAEARQIVAGIAKFYSPEELIGRKVVVVVNLKPAKLMGVESCGMLLAASDDAGNLELVVPGSVVAPGGKVK